MFHMDCNLSSLGAFLFDLAPLPGFFFFGILTLQREGVRAPERDRLHQGRIFRVLQVFPLAGFQPVAQSLAIASQGDLQFHAVAEEFGN
uniref:Uncharacterized protein n=1 Tax=Candidatus Kentrum sp. DK TaxID=2126562 RepID=A0A450RUA8_9GAMM|nr:MAG: hypothetical protein BECKDK2373B_GA0170837_100231 [Candidatus Kentron sp. DK]